jgi:hypothetical protein
VFWQARGFSQAGGTWQARGFWQARGVWQARVVWQAREVLQTSDYFRPARHSGQRVPQERVCGSPARAIFQVVWQTSGTGRPAGLAG